VKRILPVLAAVFLAVLPLSAEPAVFPESLSGEFVFYRDYSWKEPTWTGFLKYDESTYAGMVVTPSTGTKVSILFKGDLSGAVFTLTGQKIISKITNDDVPAVNYLMRLLEDMHEWRAAAATTGKTVTVPARSDLLPPMLGTEASVEMFGGSIALVHAPEVGVFSLYSLTRSDETPVLVLERQGMVRPGYDTDFFDFKPGAAEKTERDTTSLNPSESHDFMEDGVHFSLDDQWEAVAENTFFLGSSAMFVIGTLTVPPAENPQGALPLLLLRNFSRSTRNVWADPARSAVSGTAGNFTVENVFFDTETGSYNRDFKLCFPSEDGTNVTVVSLTVAEDSYEANRPYFDGILGSVSR